MKKIASFLLSLIMMISIPCAVYAGETVIEPSANQDIEYFSDGSYMVTEIETPGISVMSASTKTASKTTKYYSSDDELQWSVKLTATFSYTGSSATCTKSSVSYTIYNKVRWKLGSATATKSGRKATANYTFKMRVTGITVSSRSGAIIMSCTNSGVIS